MPVCGAARLPFCARPGTTSPVWPTGVTISADDEVLAMAHLEARVLVTLDRDFGELAVVRRQPHSGIVRLVALGAESQGTAVVSALDRYGSALSEGAIVTVESSRVRIRPPERASG